MRFLKRALVMEYGLGFPLAGWEAIEAVDISSDGRSIAGTGRNPAGRDEAWIIRLDDASAPLPPVPGVVEVRGVPVTSTNVQGAGELVSFVAGGVSYTQGDLIQPELTGFSAIANNVSIVVPTGESVPPAGARGALLTDDFQLDTGIVNPATEADAATLTFSEPLVNGPGPDLVVFEIKRSQVERPAELPDDFQIQIGGVTGVVPTSSWGPTLGTVDIDAYQRDGGAPTSLGQLEDGSFSRLSTILDMEYFGVAIDLDDFGVAPMAQVTRVDFGGIGTLQSVDPVLFMGINSTFIQPTTGDANGDGVVDIDDLNAVRNHFGTGDGTDLSGLPGDTVPFDGLVNADDLHAVRNHFGAGAPAGAQSVPEPSSLLLSFFGATGLLLARKRR